MSIIQQTTLPCGHTCLHVDNTVDFDGGLFSSDVISNPSLVLCPAAANGCGGREVPARGVVYLRGR